MLRLIEVFVLAIAVLTVVAASDGTDRNASALQTADESSLQVAPVRDKRATRWTPRPTPAEVRLFTLRTEFLSKIYRGLIRFERRWYDLMSSSSVFEVSSFLAAGVIVTFLLLFVPLFLAFNAPAAASLVAGRRKRDLRSLYDAGHNINQLADSSHVDFELDRWTDEMTRWALDTRPADRHFRCCILPASARCYPLLETRRSWYNPCPREHQRRYRDVSIDHDFRLAFH